MSIKTILDAIKKHKGQLTYLQVEQIRMAVQAKGAGKKKVIGIQCKTYPEYRAYMTKEKLARSNCIWLPTGTDHKHLNATFDIYDIREVS